MTSLWGFSPFVHQSKRKGSNKGWKDLTWHNGQIDVSTLIFCIGRKTGPILLLLVGLTAGRQAGSQVEFKIFKIFYRLSYSGIYFVYYHSNVTTVLELYLSWLLSSKAYFKVCFEVWKIWLPFFPCQSLLLGTNVCNDIYHVLGRLLQESKLYAWHDLCSTIQHENMSNLC